MGVYLGLGEGFFNCEVEGGLVWWVVGEVFITRELEVGVGGGVIDYLFIY